MTFFPYVLLKNDLLWQEEEREGEREGKKRKRGRERRRTSLGGQKEAYPELFLFLEKYGGNICDSVGLTVENSL